MLFLTNVKCKYLTPDRTDSAGSFLIRRALRDFFILDRMIERKTPTTKRLNNMPAIPGCSFRMLITVGFVFAFAVLLVQLIYYAWVIEGSSSIPKNPDMVLVYGGDNNRASVGLNVARKYRVPFFLFSGFTKAVAEEMMGKYGKPGSAKIISEDKAQTTDQNARFSTPIIRRLPVRTVVLVTSRYHMPRALFLARLYLLGTSVKVYPHPSDSPDTNIWKSRDLWRDYISFWGSIYRVFLSCFGR